MGAWNDFWDSPKGEGLKYPLGAPAAPLYAMYKGWKAMFPQPKKQKTYDIRPTIEAYDRAKESASHLLTGRAALGARGVASRLRSQGLSRMPGIQTAMALPGKYQAHEQLMNVHAKLDIERERAIQKRQRLNVAIKQWQDEKDERRKAQWAGIISKLVSAGVGFAIGGPPGAVAGAGLAKGATNAWGGGEMGDYPQWRESYA